MSRAYTPEDVLSPHGASNLSGLHIGVVSFNVLVLDKDPNKFGRTSDRLPYLLLDLCLVKLFLVFPNGLWSCAKFIFPTLGENLSNTLSYVLFLLPPRHVMLVTLCSATRKIIVGSRRSWKTRVVMFPSSLLLL